jgi:hypothetical protein
MDFSADFPDGGCSGSVAFVVDCFQNWENPGPGGFRDIEGCDGWTARFEKQGGNTVAVVRYPLGGGYIFDLNNCEASNDSDDQCASSSHGCDTHWQGS